MAITRIQSATNNGNSGVASVSFASPTGAHRCVVVGVAGRGTGGVGAAQPNGFRRLTKMTTSDGFLEFWYHNDFGVADYVAFSLALSVKWGIVAFEFDGAMIQEEDYQDIEDGSTTASGSGTTAGASSSGTSTDAGDVFVTFHMTEGSVSFGAAPTNSFTYDSETDFGGGGSAATKGTVAGYYRIPGTTATYYTRDSISTSRSWVSIHGTLKPGTALGTTKNVKYFAYEGDGNNNDEFSGLGFRPDVIFMHTERGLEENGWFTNARMQESGVRSGCGFTNVGINLGKILADGFSLYFANLNAAGYKTHGMALTRDGTTFEYGYYVGDGTDDRNITCGFAPDLVMVTSYTAFTPTAWRCSAQTGDNSWPSMEVGTDTADYIQALGATTFQVGTQLNANAKGYYWLAFKEVTGGGEGGLQVGSYSGDGSDDRNITIETGFAPQFTQAGRASGGIATHWRQETMEDDRYGPYTISPPTSDGIQRTHADGFQVGTGDNTSSVTYYYACFGAAYVVLVDSTPPERGLAQMGAGL